MSVMCPKSFPSAIRITTISASDCLFFFITVLFDKSAIIYSFLKQLTLKPEVLNSILLTKSSLSIRLSQYIVRVNLPDLKQDKLPQIYLTSG